ncbi:MAG: hypothetical protein ACJ71N_14910 [Terriglobales bacterium]|jgi:hypothetical protein
MRRVFLVVALAVFSFSVVAELICIRMVSGPVIHWLERPHREVLFASFLVINLLNAMVAAFMATSAKRAELQLQASEFRRLRTTGYINHHVRNALSAIQYAAHLTRDEQTQNICTQAITRIVRALANAESGAPGTDEDWAIKISEPERLRPEHSNS